MRQPTTAACLAVLALSPLAAADLVVNGDFEAPVIANVFLFVPRDDASITGWSVGAPTAGQGVDIISATFGGPTLANTGLQAIDLAGSPGRGTIFQTLATSPGTSYTLAFALSSNGGAITDGVTVRWGGVEVATLGSPSQGTWTSFSYDLPATSGATLLEFVGNVDGVAGTFLDTVSVEVVPAPGALVLGLLAAPVALRRRRSR